MTMNRKYIPLFVIGIVAGICVMAPTIQAADVTPFLTLRERYIRQTGIQTESRGLTTLISPALEIRQVGEASLTEINYRVSLQRRHGTLNTDDDTDADHHVTLTRQTAWTPRTKTAWDGFLIVSPDLTRFSTETVLNQAETLLIPGADTVQSGLYFQASHEASPIRTLQWGLSLNDTRYQDPSLSDALQYGVSLAQSAQITRADQLRISYGFTHSQVDGAGLDIHHVGTGYGRSVSAATAVHLHVGGGYVQDMDVLTGTFGAGFVWTVDRRTVSLSALRSITGVNRDTIVSPGSSARAGGGIFSEPTVTESVSLRIGGTTPRRLTEYVQATASRNHTLTAGEDPVAVYSIVTGIQHTFNPHWSAGLDYQYLDQRARGAAVDRSFRYHMVSAFLTLHGATWK